MAWLNAQGSHWTGGPPIPDWNLDIAQEMMDRNGIAQAVASPVPQVYWGDVDDAARWARHCNEFSASMVERAPHRFGALATLPLPDTKAAVKELEYALDTLKLDGVIMFSSFGDQYPGDPAFEELFQELDKRKAVVLIHPCTAPPGAIVPKLTIPWGLVEFIADTSRAVTNLLLSGTLHRYPSIRFIVSHAGGAIPYIAMRLRLAEEIPGFTGQVPRGTMHYLQKLYYDTALSTSESSPGRAGTVRTEGTRVVRQRLSDGAGECGEPRNLDARSQSRAGRRDPPGDRSRQRAGAVSTPGQPASRCERRHPCRLTFPQPFTPGFGSRPLGARRLFA